MALLAKLSLPVTKITSRVYLIDFAKFGNTDAGRSANVQNEPKVHSRWVSICCQHFGAIANQSRMVILYL